MKNREKFHDSIMSMEFDCNNIRKHVLKVVACSPSLNCNACRMRQMLWLDEEAEEVEWSKVEVDTQILVSAYGEVWINRYFAKFEDGKVWAWDDGATSWSTDSKKNIVYWPYAKLAEGEEE